MPELNAVIEGREMDIQCWQCGWSEPRTLCWLSAQRHMNCPVCSCVIVLDSSELRREITRQRRQLATLHGQMVVLLQSAGKISRRAKAPSRTTRLAPTMDLALARSHPNTLLSSMRSAAAAARRFPR
jgi:ribosomal protein S27E